MSPSAQRVLGDLGRAGISLDAVTDKLVEDGVELFADAADKLLGAVAEKRDNDARRARSTRRRSRCGDASDEAGRCSRRGLARRTAMCAGCGSATNRCGPAPTRTSGSAGSTASSDDQIAELRGIRRGDQARRLQRCRAARHGRLEPRPGSAGETFGHSQGCPRCTFSIPPIPAQIKAIEATIDLGKTLFIVSSKSGTHARAEYLQGLFLRARRRHGRRGQGRPAFRRHHRSRLALEKRAKAQNFRQHLLRRAQHRRPLFRAVAFRPGPGGHRRHRRRGFWTARRA